MVLTPSFVINDHSLSYFLRKKPENKLTRRSKKSLTLSVYLADKNLN